MIRAALLALLLSACWLNSRVVYVRVPVIVHQHDIALPCAQLPPFPSAVKACTPGFARDVARWLEIAGACLHVNTFDV